jgi:two-component system, NarL family, sensor kinase
MATAQRLNDDLATDGSPDPVDAAPRLRPDGGRTRINVVVALAETALIGLLVITVVVFFASADLRRRSNKEAIRDAGAKADLIAKDIIQPMLTDQFVSGDPAATARIEERTKDLIARGTVLRVKIWSTSGTVLYSDEKALVGRTFAFDKSASTAIEENRTVSSVSDLKDEENAFEVSEGSLLEVYLPVHTPNGTTLLYEDYERFSSVTRGAQRVWSVFAPLLLGALLALELLNIPLVWFLVRRVREADRQRRDLIDQAIGAADNERRRLTRDLHDGIVQELIGSSYTVAGILSRHDPAIDDATTTALGAVASATQRSIRGLRTLLVEVYPPNLETEPLESLLGELLLPLSGRGVTTRLRVDEDVVASTESKGLVWRTAREAIQNTVAHAAATEVSITARRRGDEAVLEVVDNGRGFDPKILPATPEKGHFGLRLLGDFAREYGGMLTISSTPGSGTTIILVCRR